MKTYVVNSGDTLYGISKQFGVSIDEIKRVNNLNSDFLRVGSVLNIPSNDNTTYVVKKGDSLYSISKMFNVSVDSIKELNNLTSNILMIGQVLKIKEDNLVVPDNFVIYIVKPGDTLYAIASKYGISVDRLKSINRLNSNILTIGQSLFVPGGSNIDSGSNVNINYVVLKGDTLYSIAKKFNTTVDNLIKINNLSSNNLTVGQVLTIVENVSSNLGKVCYGNGYVEPRYETYTVKKGDSLYIIANSFGTTVDNIKKLNNLTSNNLSIGQVLKIREIGG